MLPTTAPGLWSSIAFAAFLVLIGLFAVAVAAGQRGGEGFFDNLWLTAPFLAAYLAAVAAFGFGLVSLAVAGERSVVVFATTVLAFFVVLFGVLEVVFPH